MNNNIETPAAGIYIEIASFCGGHEEVMSMGKRGEFGRVQCVSKEELEGHRFEILPQKWRYKGETKWRR